MILLLLSTHIQEAQEMNYVWSGKVTPWLDHGCATTCPSNSLIPLWERPLCSKPTWRDILYDPVDENGMCALFIHVPLYLFVSCLNFRQRTCRIWAPKLIHLESISTFRPCVNTRYNNQYETLLRREDNVIKCSLFPSCLPIGISSFLFKQYLVLFWDNYFLVCLGFCSIAWPSDFKD